MIPFSEAEKPKIEDAKKRELDRVWRAGLIGDPTYLRSLFFIGYLPDEANTELNLLKLEGKQRVRDPSVPW